jgi:hypothetical protein
MKNLLLVILLTFSVVTFSGSSPETGRVISWLEVVDSGSYAASWEESAPLFQRQISSPKWVEALNQVRKPLGKVLSRKVTNSTNHSTLPGAPAGEYVVITLETSYKNKSAATETVTVSKNGDEWRVVGYFIK